LLHNFWWVILLVAVFVGGQWMMMRPNPREQRVMHLREAARKMGLQPNLCHLLNGLKQIVSSLLRVIA
jgi:cbb3-type cytochrome oxidase subunit 3